MTETDWTLALRADGSPSAILAYADWLEESGAEQGVIDAVQQLPDFAEWLLRAINWTLKVKGETVKRMVLMNTSTVHLWGDDANEDGRDFDPTPGRRKAMILLHSRDGSEPVSAWFRAATGFSIYEHRILPAGDVRTRFVRDLEWVKP